MHKIEHLVTSQPNTGKELSFLNNKNLLRTCSEETIEVQTSTDPWQLHPQSTSPTIVKSTTSK